MRSGSTLNDFMQWDNTLFDGIILNNEIDREILVSSIMLRCGLQNPLYEHYDVFKSQVHLWFAAHEWNFDRLVNLIKEKYNPLWNKDGYEERTIDHTRDEVESIERDLSTQDGGTNTVKTVDDVDQSVATSGTDTRNITDTFGEGKTTSSTGNTIHSVKGFNATDWQQTDKDERTDSGNEQRNGSNTEEDSLNYGKTERTTAGNEQNVTETFGKTETANDDTSRTLNKGQTTESVRAWGNIGLMTSQQMFLSEVELLGGFNLYDFIAKKFDDDLMIGVYTY